MDCIKIRKIATDYLEIIDSTDITRCKFPNSIPQPLNTSYIKTDIIFI